MERLKFRTLLLFFIIAGTAAVAQEGELEEIYAGIEFDMPRVKETSFPDHSRSITEFGAVAGGLVKNTEAIEKAIVAVSENGGGRVIIPRGMWLTGPVILKSNIDFHLEEGALLLFSKDMDDYPLVETSFEGLKTFRCISPISAEGAENIAITGRGTIDGGGEAWRPVKKSKMTAGQWKELVASGGVLSEDGKMWFPSEGGKKGYETASNKGLDLLDKEGLIPVKDFLRPVMISIRNSDRILLDGPTFQNSPAWNIHPLMSENIIIRNINVRNPWYSQNGDGLDLESCKNVLIYNNTFDVGDDAICFKSGKNQDGRDRGMPTENVIVKNNIVYHGHGGFVIGSEMSGGVKNVHVSNCTFMGTDVGLRFKSTRGRGGVVENIYISNINMIDIPTEGIRFNLFYGGEAPVLEEGQQSVEEKRDETPVPVTEETPSFRNIFMKNIRVTGSNRAAFFMGLPEMSLKNIHLEDAVLKADEGITIIDGSGISLKNVKVIQEKGPALTIYNSDNVDISRFEFNPNPGGKAIRVLGNSENIDFSEEISEKDIEKREGTATSKKKSPGRTIKVSTSQELKLAIENARPGDSIFVNKGRYVLNERIYINDSGTKQDQIKLVGDISEERPTLDFSSMTEDSSHQGIVLKADNWHIKGLQILGAGDNGLQVRGNHNTIEYCSFSECADSGLQLDDGAAHNLILNCDSFFNADSQLENADGFAVKMDVGSGNKFVGCRAWNNLDDGWDGYLRGTDNVETSYENCWAFKNGYLKDGTAGDGDGNGFKTGGSDNKLTKHNASYYRCLAVGNLKDGFDHNSNRGVVSLTHCSATQNGRNMAFSEKNALEKIVIINTIVLGNPGKYFGEVEEVTNNSWQNGLAATKEDFRSLDISELSAPRKPDGSLPEIDFMHLRKNSDLIDAGKDIGYPYDGKAPDLGAFESQK